MDPLLWSRGAWTRARILRLARRCEELHQPLYASRAARICHVSSSVAREQLQRMAGAGLLAPVNPGSRPVYFTLTEEGRRAEREMSTLLELGRLLRRNPRSRPRPAIGFT